MIHDDACCRFNESGGVVALFVEVRGVVLVEGSRAGMKFKAPYRRQRFKGPDVSGTPALFIPSFVVIRLMSELHRSGIPEGWHVRVEAHGRSDAYAEITTIPTND
jgi:hypothetical protein